jgi:hypothetical protein
MTAQKSRPTPAPAETAENDGTEVTADTGTRKKGQK